MNRLLASAFVSLGLGFGLCGGFGATSSAQDKPAKPNAESAYERIMAALDGPTRFDFVETPLKDVVEALKIQHGIEIQLDVRAITDAGGTIDMPVTRTVKGISLRSGLRLMLHEHELDFVVADEVLLVTHAESPALRQYDVADLLSDAESIDALADVVRFALPRASAPAAKPGDAAPSGAPGAPAGPTAGGGLGPAPEQATTPDGEVISFGTLLLVRASDRGHMHVTTLLEEMRHRRKAAQHKPVGQAASEDRPPAPTPVVRGEKTHSVNGS